MLSGPKACKSSRSRQEVSNEYLLANIGFDTAENEPLKVCGSLTYVIRNLNLSRSSDYPVPFKPNVNPKTVCKGRVHPEEIQSITVKYKPTGKEPWDAAF